MYTTLDWVALGIWIFVIIVLVYGIIAIHDIPASVARKRNHPHTDAIEAAGWVSLFMLHVHALCANLFPDHADLGASQGQGRQGLRRGQPALEKG